MICAHTAIMPHISFRRGTDDRLFDLACARWSRRHRHIGGSVVSFDIIQIIPSPQSDDAQTDFPTIAFRSARQDPIADPADAVTDQRSRPVNREA
jgi:hypothetical protein